MPIDPAALLKGLKPALKMLDKDLLDRAQDDGVDAGLKAAWNRERSANRTGDAFPLWRRRRMIQVSIAWVLSVIFVRTLEDRGFLARHRVAGPGAADSERQFTSIAPFLTSRDYILTVFHELAKLPGAGDLFDARHNPVWVLAPSADAARQLLDFFRQTASDGQLLYSFDGDDTRFLGDLYQNLSEDVRKRYALLQTPVFVEEFILDQTLDPAIRTFGLEETTLIDPTCGSGHFLIGAFHRIFDAWQASAPGKDRQELAQQALGQVFGCDLNPYAVAIARFRLTLEFLTVAGITRLDRAPELPLNLCVADSLLHGVTHQQMRLSGTVDAEGRSVWGDRLFALEDEDQALQILDRRFHAVVGNPPYISEKDPKKRAQYRDLYESAFKQYALAAPFTERFFGLAIRGGFVGMINANSFTKRDFGTVLIENVLPRFDVNKIVDTSGAYIPGHGTPTLMLFGRNRTPGDGSVVTVLGKRGEAVEPDDPVAAPVWTEIVNNHGVPGFDGRYVSVEEIPRSELGTHPWVLAGGGARRLKTKLDASRKYVLEELLSDLGRTSHTGEDPFFVVCDGFSKRRLAPGGVLALVQGTDLRDWVIKKGDYCLFPYDQTTTEAQKPGGKALCHYWSYRTTLRNRQDFGKKIEARGLGWFEHSMFFADRFRASHPIAFAAVATHNHFVLVRRKVVFKQSAPILMLKNKYAEDDHLALLGILNSSTVGLWCRLVMFLKGGDQVGDGARVSPSPWDRHLDYAGNLVKSVPIVDLEIARSQLLNLVRKMEETIDAIHRLEPQATVVKAAQQRATSAGDLRSRQESTTAELENLCRIQVSIQEEIDWRVYGLFGLPTITLPDFVSVTQPVAPEHRPFEVRLATKTDSDLSAKTWFERHERTPPVDVGGPFADLYRQRLELIEQHKELQLLETPENKRRWSSRDFGAEFKSTYRDYFLDCVERLFADEEEPVVMSARQLAGELHRDINALAVSEVYTGETAPDLERLVASLVQDEGLPFLAALTFTGTGLEKHQVWRETWALQRREDAGEKVGDIPVPPKYATKDYRRSTCWTHRGKLDVPKERFVLYPGAETDTDDSQRVGWAGWDHLQRAKALAEIYQDRKEQEGWTAEKLTPLLAGLNELVPWLIQWHNGPDAAFGGQRLGDFFRDFVGGEARAMGLSIADLEAWRPPEKHRGRPNKAAGRTPKLTAEMLLAAFPTDGGDLSQTELATALGVSKVTVGKVAKACVEAGQVIETSGRPKRYALPSQEMRTTP